MRVEEQSLWIACQSPRGRVIDGLPTRHGGHVEAVQSLLGHVCVSSGAECIR